MSLAIFDQFLHDPQALRASALRSGFGTWRPSKGDTGLNSYAGVNFVGDHATALTELHRRFGALIPGLMFFRLTNPLVERAIVHADREYGCSHTAILYLSPHLPCESGTGFYRHRETGWVEMPPLAELQGDRGLLERLRADMSNPAAWERYEFIAGIYNRCLIFNSALIHCRIPQDGFGTVDDDSRMTWTAHFNRVLS